MNKIYNVAIIAHVDHGKTTIIDNLLRQAGSFRENQQVAERVMDSNDQERERGITILAKCTAIEMEGDKINIIDTPGHADFGGEVERVLSMVDGVILLVDAAEGPMPQTKFVLTKALKLNLKPIVVINKIDRSDQRADEVINEIYELFMALDATNDQLDFITLYASGRSGWAVRDLNDERTDLKPLFNAIKESVPPVAEPKEEPFAMLACMLDIDPYLGRILIGRVHQGEVKLNMPIKGMNLAGEVLEQSRVSKLFAFSGIKRVPIEHARAGDIIAIAGLENTTVADTIASTEQETPLEALPIDPPTMAINISVNDSPIAGREGKKVTSRMIRDRLLKEAESNIAITFKESDSKESFEIGGRGELQLGVLIENMRREGFELSVSRPQVLFREEDGKLLEPMEELQVDVDEAYSGVVVEKVSLRKGEMQDMRPSGGGKIRITFIIPSRGLIGYQSEFLTDTRGTGVLSRIFHGYGEHKGDIGGRLNGALISTETGKAVAYALWNLEERGKLFINPGDEVYTGMVIGEHSRDNDLEVNPLKSKQLSNIRTTSKDEAIRLTPPMRMTLEDAISYIQDDELVEVTPKAIRLRKKFLDSNERKKNKK